eukprot:1583727-Amphidinium_carterae.1
MCRPVASLDAAGGGLREVLRHLELLHGLGAYEKYNKEDCPATATVTLVPGQMSLPKDAALIPMCVPHVPSVVDEILQTPNVFDLPHDRRPLSAGRMYMQVSDWTQVASSLDTRRSMQ